VEDLLMEPYTIHKTPDAERRSARELLEMVELPVEHATKRPHELSGGQARRIGIARALALQPSLIVADEPTAGLDVSAAASILNLMKDLRERLNLTYMLITHNLDVAGQVADRIAVMYLGQLVEIGSAEAVFADPAHPYTQALFDAAVERNVHGQRRREHRLLLPGEIPSPKNPPSGCRFHTRCRYAQERSRTEVPALEEVGPGHLVACHFWREIRDQRAPVRQVALID
jgi:oligopeptide/dipeptide ABC transporter ATP-binding protein